MNPIILYKNILNSTIPPTATDTADGYDILNVADNRAYTFWMAASAGTKYITIDCSDQSGADCLGIAGHNLYTAQATVSVESSANAVDWTERLAGFIPVSNMAFLKVFDFSSARYWRLKIITETIAPTIAVCELGPRLEMPCPPETPYIPYKEMIEADTAKSKIGHLLGAVIRHKPIEILASFTVLNRNWVFGDFKAFWDSHGSNLLPFFYAWDLTAYPEHVYYVALKENYAYQTPLSVGAFVDKIDIEMEGVRL